MWPRAQGTRTPCSYEYNTIRAVHGLRPRKRDAKLAETPAAAGKRTQQTTANSNSRPQQEGFSANHYVSAPAFRAIGVGSGGGAVPAGSGGVSTAFAMGLSPTPIGPFPPPAHRTGRADFLHPALQQDHAARTRNAISEPLLVIAGHSRYRRALPPASRSCTASPAVPLRRQACSRPDSTEPPIGQPSPFAYACDASELSATSRGVRRQSHSRRPSLLRHPSTPEAPFLDGRYPASSVLQASPPPCRPGLPLAGSRLPRARHRQGFPCCYAFHLPCMPTPLPRRKPVGALVALFPTGRRPSPHYSRVGFRIMQFSRPARRSLAFRPAWSLRRLKRPLYTRVLQSMSLPP